MTLPAHTRLFGVDFTSAPRRAKAIVLAQARCVPAGSAVALVEVESLRAFQDFRGFEDWLATPGPWVAALDLPFGLPRDLLAHWGWCAPTPEHDAPVPDHDAPAADPDAHLPRSDWGAVTRRLASLDRAALVARLRAFCDARPAGGKFAHRRTDGPAGSSPSMKWVNPPVALMLHEGAPRLLRAGVHLPGLGVAGDARRVALEGYPGLVARALVGRVSYKSDDRSQQTEARAAVRLQIVQCLEAGAAMASMSAAPGVGPAFRLEQGFRLAAPVREACLEDGTGDSLDAVLCVALAAWGLRRQQTGWGLPADTDPLEGWIVGA